ncbi:TetR/AcrR family transcriptional regulator [Dehalogenimonas sp. THU2]|uniref:TetR/AcrR family transcriptional regulator n=1 Tax=Dehalogenimonas sp. THU2 TaxID=3151121 RepID=UPI003218963B
MMKTTDGRLQKGEARRAQVVEAALRVFAERGFACATIKDIGAAAGMSPALLYHYFAGKEELLQAVVERYSLVGDMGRFIIDNQQLPAGEFLKTLARHFYDLLGDRLDLVRLFLREGASNDTVAAAWRGMLQTGFPLVKGYFDRQIALGRLRPHHSEVTVRTLGTAIVMLRFTEPIFAPRTVSGHAYIDELIDNLFLGIAPDECCETTNSPENEQISEGTPDG